MNFVFPLAGSMHDLCNFLTSGVLSECLRDTEKSQVTLYPDLKLFRMSSVLLAKHIYNLKTKASQKETVYEFWNVVVKYLNLEQHVS